MININKIILVIINIDRGDFVPSLDLFDYHVYITEDLFVGLAIDNPNLRYELNECGGTVYNPDMFANLSLKRITPMLEYIGYNLDVNDILDIMLDEEVDLTRKFYLETVLYYKSNQEGKKINEYKLRVKHFDDLSMDFPEDFVSYEVVSNNEDFSESEIIMETYLTKSEINDKFKEYLIKII